ncbi:MAG: gliding motility-associated C-terminal domain-containing protein [Bacteroidota bacterium]|jgi:gliding motility-associated-like protein
MLRISLIILFLRIAIVKSQCLKIESILVDACNSGAACTPSTLAQENRNEMFIFSVGSTSINTASLTVNWPNNSFQGWKTPDAYTASNVSLINSTILGCGLLIEPTNSVIPANSKVIVVSGFSMCPLGNSFAALTETLYVLFQNNQAGTAGHFKNFCGINIGVGPSTVCPTTTFTPPPTTCCDGTATFNRSLTISYAPLSCTNTAVFDIRELTNIFGTSGGTSNQNDGAAVFYDNSMNPSYLNIGCQAPFIPLSIAASGPTMAICNPTNVVVTASVVGTYSTFVWTGGMGSFSNPSSLTTTYTPSLLEGGAITLTCTASKPCGTTTAVSSTVITINVNNAPASLNVSATNNGFICSGNSITLSGSVSNASLTSGLSYTWLPGGINSSSLTVNSAGIYSLITQNACGQTNSQYTVNSGVAPTISLSASSTSICAGSTATLVATSSSPTYTWSNGSTSNSIVVTPSNTASYSVITTNTCGSSSANVSVNVIAIPTLQLSNLNVNLCYGTNTIIIASTNYTNNLNWSTGASSTQLNINNSGVYTASVTNVCGNAVQNVTVSIYPELSLAPQGNSVICNTNLTNYSVASLPDAVYNWAGASIIGPTNLTNAQLNAGGIYTVSVTNTITNCSNTVTFSVNQVNTNALFSASSLSGDAPLSVNFNNLSSGATNYVWSFSNLGSSTNTNSAYTFNSPGIYTVTLVASLNGTCNSIYTQEITVNEGLGIIPEVVTANGDGKNDLFQIKGLERFVNNHLQIYNRWGNLVYEAKPYKNDWAGKNNVGINSGLLPSGTYYVILNFGSENSEVYKGYVQLQY